MDDLGVPLFQETRKFVNLQRILECSYHCCEASQRHTQMVMFGPKMGDRAKSESPGKMGNTMTGWWFGTWLL